MKEVHAELSRSILEAIPHIVWATSAEGSTTYLNHRGTERLGITADQLSGWNWLQLVHPEDLERSRRLWDAAVRAGTSYVNEYRLRQADGSYRWYLAQAEPRYDIDGRTAGWMGTWTDIDDRRRAETERDQITNRLRLQIDRMPLAYLLFDRDLRIVDWNAAAERIFGYSKDEVLGMVPPFSAIVPPSARPASDEVLGRLRAGDMAAHLINDNVTKDGRTITCEWSNTPLVDPDGNFAGLISLAQDITERRRADEALRASEERFRQIAESISEVFWLTTPDKHEIAYVSAGYETIWGRTRDALYASPQSWMDAIHADDRETVARAAFTNQLAGGYDEEYRIVRPDGTLRWIRDRAFPVLDATGGVVRIAGVAEDITAKKEAEHRLLVTSEQLRALSANLNRAREEEGRRIARELHDELGGSLSAIKWDIERLASGLADHPAQELSALKQRLSAVAGTVAATAETVRRIASELRPSMLDDLGLIDAIEWHAHEFERRTGIACTVDRSGTAAVPPPSIATALFRVFQEALTNILRHAQASAVDIRIVSRDDAFELAIRDDGIGMASDDTAVAGLGIIGMRERAALIGATLEVSSRRDQGTEIRIYVPLHDDPGVRRA